MPRLSRGGGLLARPVRESDLRRRRRQHRVAGVGIDAGPQGLHGAAAGAGHGRVRVDGVPARPAAAAESAERLYRDGERQRAAAGLRAAVHVQGRRRPVRAHHSPQAAAEVRSQKYSLDDHRRMQLDALSLAAAADVQEFKGWTAPDADVERARALLAAWDGIYRARRARTGALRNLAADTSHRGGDHRTAARKGARVHPGEALEASRRSAHRRPGAGPREVAMGPHARTRVPPSARARVRSARRRARRRQRYRRRRRRQLTARSSTCRTGIDRSPPTPPASRASPAVRSTATCCRSGRTTSTSRFSSAPRR